MTDDHMVLIFGGMFLLQGLVVHIVFLSGVMTIDSVENAWPGHHIPIVD